MPAPSSCNQETLLCYLTLSATEAQAVHPPCCYTRQSQSPQTCSTSSALRSVPISHLNLPQTGSVRTRTEYFFLSLPKHSGEGLLATGMGNEGRRGWGGMGGPLLLLRDRNAVLHTRRATQAGIWWASAGRYICSSRLMNGCFSKTGIFLVGTPSDKHKEIPNSGSTFKALELWIHFTQLLFVCLFFSYVF